MRIQAQSQSIDTVSSSNIVKQSPVQMVSKQTELPVENQIFQEEEQPISKEKLQQAVNSMNDLLKTNHSSSKFVYHEGLNRYYVTVVDEETDKVIKEIPPKKLLDAFYEMQKLVGMIVDEKI